MYVCMCVSVCVQRNGVLISGYAVEGTLAKHIMSEPKEIESLSGAGNTLSLSPGPSVFVCMNACVCLCACVCVNV